MEALVATLSSAFIHTFDSIRIFPMRQCFGSLFCRYLLPKVFGRFKYLSMNLRMKMEKVINIKTHMQNKQTNINNNNNCVVSNSSMNDQQ